MTIEQCATLLRRLFDLSDEELETIRKVVEQLQHKRAAEKRQALAQQMEAVDAIE